MLDFIQSYGLWIALAGVFVAMHWFGMGCCGGGHRQRPTENTQGGPGERPKGEQPSEAPKPKASCH